MNPLVTLDERRVRQLLADPAVRAQIPPLAEAAEKLSAAIPRGCSACQQRRLMAAAVKAGRTPFTMANVKTVIGTLGKAHVLVLKKALNARRYRITYLSPGNRMVTLTV